MAPLEGDLGVVGITAYAADKLGDVVFVELPAVGRTIAAGEAFGVIESVKTASDLYAPVSGEVVEINAALGTTRSSVTGPLRRRLDAPHPPGRRRRGRRAPRRRRLRALIAPEADALRPATRPTTARACSRRSASRRSTSCSPTSPPRCAPRHRSARARTRADAASARCTASPPATARISRASWAPASTATTSRRWWTRCSRAASSTPPTRPTSRRSARARCRRSSNTSR